MHKFVLGHTAPLSYSLPVACVGTPSRLKNQVTEFWNAEPCGTRYLDHPTEFECQTRARYRLEPYIPQFAGFAGSRDLRVLEIGVGMGADYEQWLKAGAVATGVDLSNASLDHARRRCELASLKPDLRMADAEDLPFPDNTFDVVYSYGVMHHSPDTARCLQEAWRVLKPGGQARIMLYHHASLTGFMLWLRYGLWCAQSIRQCVYQRLESPGTKTFTKRELLSMMREFKEVRIEQVFSPGDLLLHKPSAKFESPVYRLAWMFFPRTLVRKLGRRWGLFNLITGRKPFANATGCDATALASTPKVGPLSCATSPSS